jgi:hypothetical protein
LYLIIARVLNTPGITYYSVIDDFVPILVSKLSDNKIVVRHGILKSMGIIAKSCAFKLLEILLPHINSENWHVREEVINVINMCFIYDCSISFNSGHILKALSTRLQDEKAKVRQVAGEAIAVYLAQSNSNMDKVK